MQVSFKAASNSIEHNARNALAKAIAPFLAGWLPGLLEDRIYMTFEELPVQNIAVGSSIMKFNTMHTAPSA
jgi:hypothetical protein